MTDEIVEDLRALHDAIYLGKGYPGQYTEHLIPLIKRCSKLTQERDELKRQVESLTEENARLARECLASRWRRITKEDMPKVGDEVLWGSGNYVSWVLRERPYTDWERTGHTHRRPINPPEGP